MQFNINECIMRGPYVNMITIELCKDKNHKGVTKEQDEEKLRAPYFLEKGVF
jgi:hypothetical protein